jgi:hypothetical protein
MHQVLMSRNDVSIRYIRLDFFKLLTIKILAKLFFFFPWVYLGRL